MHVSRHRNQSFETMVFENWSRSEAVLVTSMAEMVVNGVSTRKVSKVVETLCGESYSKSTVSKVCKGMNSAVSEFKDRKLTQNYPFLTIDATYFKVRDNHSTVSKAFMIAYGTNHSKGIVKLWDLVYTKTKAREPGENFYRVLVIVA